VITLNEPVFFLSKTVLARSLEVAKDFRVYLPQFGDPISEISDQNFQNCGNIQDILEKTFGSFKWFLLVIETKLKKL